jgi:branched-chain amino acid transport system ATP-binding protein
VKAAETVLELDGVGMDFGGVVAMHDVSITVERGRIFGIIGPNGAGKTTLFNCVTGVFRPTRGNIALNGRSIVGLKPHRITEAGVARTFQNIRLFPDMTALDNVLVGTDARHGTSVPGAVLGLPRHRREERTGWPTSASPPAPPTWPATCPTAISAAWRSPGPWPPVPASCCWTSRPPG